MDLNAVDQLLHVPVPHLLLSPCRLINFTSWLSSTCFSLLPAAHQTSNTFISTHLAIREKKRWRWLSATYHFFHSVKHLRFRTNAILRLVWRFDQHIPHDTDILSLPFTRHAVFSCNHAEQMHTVQSILYIHVVYPHRRKERRNQQE